MQQLFAVLLLHVWAVVGPHAYHGVGLFGPHAQPSSHQLYHPNQSSYLSHCWFKILFAVSSRSGASGGSPATQPIDDELADATVAEEESSLPTTDINRMSAGYLNLLPDLPPLRPCPGAPRQWHPHPRRDWLSQPRQREIVQGIERHMWALIESEHTHVALHNMLHMPAHTEDYSIKRISHAAVFVKKGFPLHLGNEVYTWWWYLLIRMSHDTHTGHYVNLLCDKYPILRIDHTEPADYPSDHCYSSCGDVWECFQGMFRLNHLRPFSDDQRHILMLRDWHDSLYASACYLRRIKDQFNLTSPPCHVVFDVLCAMDDELNRRRSIFLRRR